MISLLLGEVHSAKRVELALEAYHSDLLGDPRKRIRSEMHSKLSSDISISAARMYNSAVNESWSNVGGDGGRGAGGDQVKR